ncbi:prepilin-type N-terminal cleavage/methylation domain-containing protein [Sporosarcina psychrophila]|uniref:prepilin-type N-terminal cleavage/methylation domain-containing protein n=1 Tax=Sporosarcina psychrophila TaxID=1476 RepID=UPI00078E9B61|nr:prepilin-type N-terminal cleavage/methylation domain-containing protein [Sporosarcina psychrophila]AMQ05971.1 hypothetical protein AZE41_08600 [Sporosarcina psychrophila]
MDNKQSGLTLVEVLVTLVLSTLVVALIWTTVSISMKYNITESKKLLLQQEANYIITKLQQEHRHRDCYKINIEKEQVSIGNCENEPSFQEVVSTGFYYLPVVKKDINTKKEDLSLISFTIINSENEKLKVKVKVPILITRYRSE